MPHSVHVRCRHTPIHGVLASGNAVVHFPCTAGMDNVVKAGTARRQGWSVCLRHPTNDPVKMVTLLVYIGS